MCELYIRTVDKINPDDPYLDVACAKRGDVVVAVEDGWQWGSAELASPQHMILRCPGVAVRDITSLLAPEPQTDPTQPSRMVQRRHFTLNLDHPAVKDGATLDDLFAARVRKPPIPDPNVLD